MEITLTKFVIYALYLTNEGNLETSFKWDFMFIFRSAKILCTDSSSYLFIKASRKGVKHCFCELCRSDFSISHGGLGDVTRHINTDKHKSNAKDVETSQSLSMFVRSTQFTKTVFYTLSRCFYE
jgi:hypothetical protein